MKRITGALCITTICFALTGFVTSARAAGEGMRVYSYVSQSAGELLHKAGLSDNELENFVAKGLQERSIKSIDNQLMEGEEDAVRVDLRKKGNSLVIDLSVRQGASVHNMLQRWEGTKTLKMSKSTQSTKLHSDILNALTALLDDLKSNYNSAAYKKGSMMEE